MTMEWPNREGYFIKLLENDVQNPVIIKRSYKNLTLDELRLHSSTDIGALLIDGFGDGVWIDVENIFEPAVPNNLYVKSFIKNKRNQKNL